MIIRICYRIHGEIGDNRWRMAKIEGDGSRPNKNTDDMDSKYFSAGYDCKFDDLLSILPIVVWCGGLTVQWGVGYTRETRQHCFKTMPPPILGTLHSAVMAIY